MFLRRRSGRPSEPDSELTEQPRADDSSVGRGACAAPHSSLYFEPSGLVTACCANSAFELGRIRDDGTSDGLRSIWNGVRTAQLGAALDNHDYSLGCDECATGVDAGDGDLVLAREFDRYWDQLGSDYPLFMDFALSNTCNLQCQMCNGELSSAIRSQREGREPLDSPYGDRFFDELREFLPHLREASFKGGEPFLARETRRVWDLLLAQERRPRVTVTTNGTQWNDRVEHYVRELRMHVILSVDGTTAATVESIRSGAEFDRLQENIERFRAATAEAGGSLVLNYCLMPQNWHEFGDFLVAAESRSLHVHAIPVVAPRQFDLLHLSTNELTTVVGQLERQDGPIRARLIRNGDVWGEQVARLRSRLDHRLSNPVTPTAVDLISRTSAFDRVLDSMRAASNDHLLELRLEAGVVCVVESPPWAEELLSARSWVGLAETDLMARVSHAVQMSSPKIHNEERTPGVSLVTLDFGDAAGHRLTAARLSDPMTDSTARIAIARPDPRRSPSSHQNQRIN